MMATIATQPLIVAKVGLQSKPPPAREGKPFKSFGEVMSYIIEHEGLLSLFKGIGPQILKGLLVQGLLMMTKERCVFTSPAACPVLIYFQNGAHVHRPLPLCQAASPAAVAEARCHSCRACGQGVAGACEVKVERVVC